MTTTPTTDVAVVDPVFYDLEHMRSLSSAHSGKSAAGRDCRAIRNGITYSSSPRSMVATA
jgi:hypothetical protein